MEPTNNTMPTRYSAAHIAWAAVVAVIVIGIALLSGMQLARSNSDIACSRSASDQGACTSGSWSGWTTVSESNGTAVEQRTYTGLRNTIAGQFNYVTVVHAGCNPASARNETGTITSSYSACQIQETRTRSIAAGTRAEDTANNAPAGSIIDSSQTETTGDVATSTQVSGGYSMYLNILEARLATSSIRVQPAILRSGDTTKVIWTSDHVKSCTVVGGNGDSWPKAVTGTRVETDAEGNQVNVPTSTMPDGKTGNETSLPITQQTTYTLTCLTALGNSLVSRATVILIPVFEEQ